jgi:hypothetical protein
MVAVGEESGSLDDMMEEIGQLYQREVEYELKTLGAADRADPHRRAGHHGADPGAGRVPADVGPGQGWRRDVYVEYVTAFTWFLE